MHHREPFQFLSEWSGQDRKVSEGGGGVIARFDPSSNRHLDAHQRVLPLGGSVSQTGARVSDTKPSGEDEPQGCRGRRRRQSALCPRPAPPAPPARKSRRACVPHAAARRPIPATKCRTAAFRSGAGILPTPLARAPRSRTPWSWWFGEGAHTPARAGGGAQVCPEMTPGVRTHESCRGTETNTRVVSRYRTPCDTSTRLVCSACCFWARFVC